MGKKNKSLYKKVQNSVQNNSTTINNNSTKQTSVNNKNVIEKPTQNHAKPTLNVISQTQTTKQIKKSAKNKNKSNNSKINNQQTISNPIPTPQVKGKPWSQLQYTLREEILQTLKRCGFKTMLPVQQASIPLLLKNYDLAVQAQTGSGKTLSFLIPLLEKYLAMNLYTTNTQIQDDKSFKTTIKYLIVSPTRQLCQQTFSVLTKLINCLPSTQRAHQYLKYIHCATGGSDMNSDIQKLKDSTIVFVGTIGRIRQLKEHMDQNWLKKVDYLYIDEADRVLKQNGIESLISSVQKIRRTAMFSATLQTLNQKNFDFYGMRNLAKISLKQTSNTSNTTPNSQNTLSNAQQEQKKYIIPKSLTNTFIKLPTRLQKLQFLTNFLINNIQSSKIIVFFNTCASVDFYTNMFNAFFKLKQQEEIVGLHGKLKTKRREKLIKKFLDRKNGCLFATDVVSRGIDFDYVHFILQVDPPEDPDNYVHRIGRTARINRPGTAILLIQEHQDAFINYLAQKSVGVQQITNPAQYYDKNQQIQPISKISQRMDQIMRTDRDYVEKSKKAFVSYIRSYKEHDLRYIFEFKNLDIGKTAHSFFMYRIPRIKQILGKSINSFTQSEVDIEAIPWLDKNQELQFSKKKQRREEELVQKKRLERRLQKHADAKNNKSKRKRIKNKIEGRNQQIMNKEHREFLKQRIGGRTKKNDDSDENGNQNQDYSFNDSDDTEQIQQRMVQKNDKSNKSSYNFQGKSQKKNRKN